MAREIEDRIVAMEFDNSNFEKNVKQSMNTLDKLKKSLNFDDSLDNLDDLSTAIQHVDAQSIAQQLENLNSRFSYFGTFAGRIVENLADKFVSLMGAVKNFSDQFTVATIGMGWGKYNEQINATQTILSAVSTQGKTLADVEETIEQLSWFSDETSYSLSEMTNSLAKFTATGTSLEDAKVSMQGIATWMGLAGVNTANASRAFYNLSQAMGVGYLNKQDYNSIVNLNANTVEWQKAMLNAAVMLGTLKKTGEDTYTTLSGKSGNMGQMFSEYLREGWATKDVMIDVFKTFGAYAERIKTIQDTFEEAEGGAGLLANQAIDLSDAFTEGGYSSAKFQNLLKKFGLEVEETDERLKLLDATGLELSKKAFLASQEAKTWEDTTNAIQDAISTGWMRTFKILFGNLDEAKTLWGNVYEILYDIFATSGDIRNSVLADWKERGGVIDLIHGIQNGLNLLRFTIVPVKDAIASLFPSASEIEVNGGSWLYDLTKKFANFTDFLLEVNELSDKENLWSLGWEDLEKYFLDNMDVADEASQAAITATESFIDLRQAVRDVINGKYGNGDARKSALGENFAVIQEAVNTVLWSGKPLEEALASLSGSIGMVTENLDSASESAENNSDAFDNLRNKTELFEATSDALKDDYRNNWIDIFHGIYSAVQIVSKVVHAVAKTIKTFVLPTLNRLWKIAKAIAGAFGVFVSTIDDSLASMSEFDGFIDMLAKLLEPLSVVFDTITDKIIKLVNAFASWVERTGSFAKVRDILKGIVDNFLKFVESSGAIQFIASTIEKIFDFILHIGEHVSNLYDAILQNKTVQDILNNISEAIGKISTTIENFSWSNFLPPSFTSLISKFSGWIDNIYEKIFGIKKTVTNLGGGSTFAKNLIPSYFSGTNQFLPQEFSEDIVPSNFFDVLTKTIRDFVKSLTSSGFTTALGNLVTLQWGWQGLTGLFKGEFTFSYLNNAIKMIQMIFGLTEETSDVVEEVSNTAEESAKKTTKIALLAEGVFAIIVKVVDGIAYAVEKFGELLGKIFAAIQRGFAWIPETLGNVQWELILRMIDQVVAFMTAATFGRVAVILSKAFDKIASVAGAIGGIFKAIAGAITDISTAMSKKLKAEAFASYADGIYSIAKSILAVAAAAYLLSKIPAKDLIAIGTGLLFFSVVVIGVAAAITGLKKVFAAAKIAETSKGFSSIIDAVKGFVKSLNVAFIGAAALEFTMAIGALVGIIYAIGKLTDTAEKVESFKRGIDLLWQIVAMVAAIGTIAAVFGAMSGPFTSLNLIGLTIFMGALVLDIGVLVGIVVLLAKLTKPVEGAESDFNRGMESLAGLFILLTASLTVLSMALVGAAKPILALAVLSLAFAGAILLFIKAIDNLTKIEIKPESLNAIFIGLIVLFTGIAFLLSVAKDEFANTKADGLKGAAALILAVGAFAYLIPKAIKNFNGIRVEDWILAMASLGLMALALIGLVKSISSVKVADLKGLAFTIISLSAAMFALGLLCSIMSVIPAKAGLAAMLMVGGLLLALGAAVMMAGSVANGKTVAIGMAATIAAFAYFMEPAIESLAELYANDKTNSARAAAITIGLLLLALGATLLLAKDMSWGTVAGMLVGLGGMALVAAKIADISQYPVKRIETAGTIMLALIVVLGIILQLVNSGTAIGTGIGLIMAAAAIWVLTQALIGLASLDTEQFHTLIFALLGIVSAIIVLGAVTAIFGAFAAELVGGALVIGITALAVLSLSAGFYVMVEALGALAAIDWSSLTSNIDTIGSVLIVLGAILAGVIFLLYIAKGPVLVASGVMLVFGVALYVVAGAVNFLIDGLIKLMDIFGYTADTSVASSKLISDSASGIRNAMSGITEDAITQGEEVAAIYSDNGNAAASNFKGSYAEEIRSGEAISTEELMSSIGLDDSLIAQADQYGIDLNGAFINSFANFDTTQLQEQFGQFGDLFGATGTNCMEALAGSLTGGSENVNAAGVNVCDLLLGAVTERLGISSPSTEFISIGEYCMEGLDFGLETGYNEVVLPSVPEIISALLELIRSRYEDFVQTGRYLAEGFAVGMEEKISRVREVAARLASEAAEALNLAAEVRSPSRLTRVTGGYFGEGFALGILDSEDYVVASAGTISDKAVSAMNDALSYAMGVAMGSINTEPVIKPILDLSSVEAGASRMSSLFHGSSVGNMTLNESNDNTAKTGSVLNYTQNNYSPKALSSLDIYRQTRNTLAQMKEKLA